MGVLIIKRESISEREGERKRDRQKERTREQKSEEGIEFEGEYLLLLLLLILCFVDCLYWDRESLKGESVWRRCRVYKNMCSGREWRKGGTSVHEGSGYVG